jgi:hypothetical protein
MPLFRAIAVPDRDLLARISGEIVGRRGAQRRVEHSGGARHEQEGVAVRLRIDHGLRADLLIGADDVLDMDRLPDDGARRLREFASGRVGDRAGAAGDDQPDRPPCRVADRPASATLP